jgi:diguanylate cyclase (GGDEF)-like protein/PAS domain S-box-containing protein
VVASSPAALRALIVEDLEDDCALLLAELKRGGYAPDHRRVDTADDLEAALVEREWDIVFGDYTIPGFSGTEALAQVRRHTTEIPFIFLSGTIGEDVAVSAMRAGAQDYIMKDNLKRLLPAVERSLEEFEVRRASIRAEAEQHVLETRFRKVLGAAADAIIAVDEGQRITLFNRGAKQLFGYRAREVLGQPLDLLIPARFHHVHRQHVQESAVESDGARPMNPAREVFGLRRDGSEFPAEASISKLVEDGRAAYLVILRDITERKRAEMELRLLHGIAQDAGAAADIGGALAVAMARVCEIDQWNVGEAWLPDTESGRMVLSGAWHCGEPGLEAFHRESHCVGLDEGLIGRGWATRECVWSPDLATDPVFRRQALARAAELKSGLAVPVRDDAGVIAVLAFFSRHHRPVDPRSTRLMTSVSAQLGTLLQRKRIEQRLQHMAHHDSLTGLPNRVLFMDRLQQGLREAERRGRMLAVAFLDLDRFKAVNDSLGHAIGDQLLCQVAAILSAALRCGDSVARVAGDEFTFVLNDLKSIDEVARIARRILDSLSQPIAAGGHTLFINASMGVSLFPADDRNAEKLLRNADIAMYGAKERGRGSFQFFSAEMAAEAKARLDLEYDLRNALAQDELLLHYQPVVDLSRGCVEGVEALMRWQRADGRLISPAEFIPVAEDSGLIDSLGHWALETACRQWRGRRNPQGERCRIAVNVSPRQFYHGKLTQVVRDVVTQTGFDPCDLDLEITESVLIGNADTTLEVMRELGELGVRFSIDDFGTGYSSFSYLKRLPIGRVKIDRVFVSDVPADANDAAIVAAIISMARSLGLEVIAEGVETREQAEYLVSCGCTRMQGFLFWRPLPAPTVGEIIDSETIAVT